MKCEAAEDRNKSGFVERLPELSLFFKAFSLLNSEMICIFPYFCPCEIIVREIREISFSHCLPPCRITLSFSGGVSIDIHSGTYI